MPTQKIENVLSGNISLQKGAFLGTQADLIEDQKSWGEEDGSKKADFTTCPYWLTTDDGQDPVGIDSDSDIEQWLS